MASNSEELHLRSDISITVSPSGDTVLLDQASGKYWQLNPTGARVVRILVNGGSVEQAVETIDDEAEGVDTATVRSDVEDFVDTLVKAGLMRT